MQSPDESRPRLIAGLGNPGARYRGTRHNLGFRVVELLAARSGRELARLECNALLAIGDRVVLAEPQTYMNRSGYALRCLVEKRGFQPSEVLVVYDEAALPLGTLRLRPRGGPGGHRGMESVIQNLRTEEVPRLRLGIAPEGGSPAGEELVDFVLSPFEPAEGETVEEMIERAADACESWLRVGAQATMDRFNA